MSDENYIDALEHVDRSGDMPGPLDAPTAIALRERGLREHAMRWCEDRGRYVLTGTGRLAVSRRRARSGGEGKPHSAEIRPFRRKA